MKHCTALGQQTNRSHSAIDCNAAINWLELQYKACVCLISMV